MSDLLAHPAFQSAALPFLTALCVAAGLGFSGTRPARYADFAASAGFFVGFVFTFGIPVFPPITSGHKIIYVTGIAAILGLTCDRWILASRNRFVLALGLIFMAILWIGWRKITGPLSLDHWRALAVFAGSAIALSTADLNSVDNDTGLHKTVSMLILSLGVGGIAFMGASASIAQNAAALAAALGGVLILNWPTHRFGLGPTARLVPVVIVSILVAQAVFFTSVSAWAFPLLLPALFADQLVQRWKPANRAQTTLVKPILIALLSLVPVAFALGAAGYASLSSDLSGGY